jgi:UDP-glucose 4-epimerase
MLTHLTSSACFPARVVVLGAKGFVARALTGALEARKVPVRAVSSAELDLSRSGAGEQLTRILQPADALVMTAALTAGRGRDNATLMRNLSMAEQVAAALSARPCAHFLYISSVGVYDWRSPLISESTAPSPTDHYGVMHLTREKMLEPAAASGQIPCCILRASSIYGPGDTQDSYGPNRFVRTARVEGKIRLFGDGEEMRDHVFIDDVVSIAVLVLGRRSSGVLNVVSGRSASFRAVAEEVARLRHPLPVTLESEPRRLAVLHRHFDPSALFRSFPEHRPTPWKEGIRRYLAAP